LRVHIVNLVLVTVMRMLVTVTRIFIIAFVMTDW
jgi:hypothetical protein